MQPPCFSAEDFAAKAKQVRFLARGAFGDVWEYDWGGERVALKCIAANGPEYDSVLREVKILASLEHPNIILYRGCFYRSNYIQIVTELADAGDLDGKIREARANGTKFPEEFVGGVLVQLLLGLKYIHANRVIHRDLKPANVFLTKENVVKIGDFGVSAVLSTLDQFKMSHHGTLSYISPQIYNDEPYNYSTDLWALGCIAYEMMTLRRAFESQSILELANKIRQLQYDPIPSGEYPQELCDIVQKDLLVKHRTSTYKILRKPIIGKYIGTLFPPLLQEPEYQAKVEEFAVEQAKEEASSPTEALRSVDEFLKSDKSLDTIDSFLSCNSDLPGLRPKKSASQRASPVGGLKDEGELRKEVQRSLVLKELHLLKINGEQAAMRGLLRGLEFEEEAQLDLTDTHGLHSDVFNNMFA